MLLLLLIGLWALPAGAATIAAENVSPEGPIDITAERLDADEQNGTAVFSGQVIAKRGDMTVYAETLTLYRVGTTKQLERIEASGGVRIVQQDRVGTAQRARYELAEEKLILSGDAHVQQGQNQVSGDEIILFVEENRSLVKSGEDGRVRAVFFPEKEQK
jgi:lipopolysaccharide export system protein LptA